MEWYNGLSPETKKIALDILSHCHFTGELVNKVDPDCGCAVHRAWRTEVAEKNKADLLQRAVDADAATQAAVDKAEAAAEALEWARVDADTSASAIADAEARYRAAADEAAALQRAYDATNGAWSRLKGDYRELLSKFDVEGSKLNDATAELKRVKDLVKQIL